MRSLFNILVLALIVLLVSCEKHEQIPENGTNGTINIILKSSQMEDAMFTKAINQLPEEGTESGYKVKDYWFLQYSSNGELVGDAKYIEVAQDEEYKTPVLMPQEGNQYYCLFIANTHNPDLNNPESSTGFYQYKGSLASMTNFYKKISSLEDTYNVNEQDLIMSGITKLEPDDTVIYCKLFRNIAKVTVNLTNKENSGITIKSINIRNVPGGALYADRLLKETLPGVAVPTAPFPDSYSLSYIDYELDNISIASGSQGSFVWYLPRNMKGDANEAVSADLKNKYAPELATYVEIYAVTGDGDPLKYKFYLGNNAKYNFDVEPNKHYILPITFVDKGSVLDSRVDYYNVINLSGASNSYIINPLPIQEQALYSLPITRVNEFWNSTDAQVGVDNTISAQTEWVAEVIWQDQPTRMINFVGGSDNSPDRFTSTGGSAFNFEVIKESRGNILVGVRKSSDTKYLWSWHLWLTDYNPDSCSDMPWVEDKYVYYVEGGQVHRYAGDFWRNNYMDKYIMDRNLGALSANREDGLKMTGGFAYQYGRKDPIPYRGTALYNINGETISFSGNNEDPIIIIQGPAAIYESVYTPYSFYNVADGDWATNNPHTTAPYSWNGPSKEKSIYDPCPDGWMVPMNETWEIFGTENQTNVNSNQTMRDTETAGAEFYIDAVYGSAHKEYNISYFPAMGLRNVYDGELQYYALRGYAHCTQSGTSDKRNLNLDFRLTNSGNVKVYTSNTSSRGRGITVRCIREYAANQNTSGSNHGNEIYIQQPL